MLHSHLTRSSRPVTRASLFAPQDEPKGGWGKRKNAYYDGRDYEARTGIIETRPTNLSPSLLQRCYVWRDAHQAASQSERMFPGLL